MTLCKVSSIGKRTRFAIFKFKLLPTVLLKHQLGKYIKISYQGVMRSYTIANADSDDDIELHIKCVSNGVMSALFFSDISVNSPLRADGPTSTFFVRTDTKSIIFAGETGFAPVK